ncbi:MAG: PQQ-binding-like beta-propeller repeat protein [candidate division WOR-3 bacterium]
MLFYIILQAPVDGANTTWLKIRGSQRNTGVQFLKGNFGTGQTGFTLKWYHDFLFTSSDTYKCSNLTGDSLECGCEGEPVIFDVNGDGRNDVIFGWADSVSTHTASVKVLNGLNGSVIWDFAPSGFGSHQSPAIGDVNSSNPGSEIVVLQHKQNRLHILRLNGTEICNVGLSNAALYSSPIIIPDISGDGLPDIVFTYAEAPNISCLSLVGCLVVRAVRGDCSNIWTRRVQLSPPHAFMPPLGTIAYGNVGNNGNRLYALANTGLLVALNPANGNVIWQFSLLPTGGGYWSTPAIADFIGPAGNGDEMIVTNYDNYVILVRDNGTSASIVWVDTLGGSPPYNVNTSVGVWDIDSDGCDDYIFGYSQFSLLPRATARKGNNKQIIWDIQLPDAPGAIPSYHSGAPRIADLVPANPGMEAVIATGYTPTENSIYLISLNNGNILWRFKASDYIPGGATFEGGAIADIDGDGCAEIINLPSFNNNARVVVLDDPSNSTNCGTISYIKPTCSQTPLDYKESLDEIDIKIITKKGGFKAISSAPINWEIMEINGRVIKKFSNMKEIEFSSKAGIYIIKAGKKSKTILIR